MLNYCFAGKYRKKVLQLHQVKRWCPRNWNVARYLFGRGLWLGVFLSQKVKKWRLFPFGTKEWCFIWQKSYFSPEQANMSRDEHNISFVQKTSVHPVLRCIILPTGRRGVVRLIKINFTAHLKSVEKHLASTVCLFWTKFQIQKHIPSIRTFFVTRKRKQITKS